MCLQATERRQQEEAARQSEFKKLQEEARRRADELKRQEEELIVAAEREAAEAQARQAEADRVQQVCVPIAALPAQAYESCRGSASPSYGGMTRIQIMNLGKGRREVEAGAGS